VSTIFPNLSQGIPGLFMPEPDAYKLRSGLAHGGSLQEQDEVQAIIQAMRARRARFFYFYFFQNLFLQKYIFGFIISSRAVGTLM